MPKYIFVSGGVISGLGKGIIAASIALLLKNSGYKVVPIKFENYLNIDSGTINPIEHGDPFLCEDGLEADMDLGTYEKFLGQDMGHDNFLTLGQVYKGVIDKERRFEYDGEDVEAIPHVTDFIIDKIDQSIKNQKADIAMVELGGTVGEFPNIPYYEAYKILQYRKPKDVMNIHVSYVPNPRHLGEPKSKPAQLSVRMLGSFGIKPDLLVVRSEKPLDMRRKERLSLMCYLDKDHVITSYNVPSVYKIPILLHDQNVHKIVAKKLGLKNTKVKMSGINKVNKIFQCKKKRKLKIAIVGKYFATGDFQLKDSYAALFDAIDHASWHKKVDIRVDWISSEEVEKVGIKKLINDDVKGLIVPIGWGDRGSEGMVKAASFARKTKLPYLGLCYGMQLAAVAFARDVLKLRKANTEENNKKCKDKVIHLMHTQKSILQERAYGGTMRLGGWEAFIKKGSYADMIYSKYDGYLDKKTRLVSERHRHRYEFNDKYADLFNNNGMTISARSKIEGLAEIIELDKSTHPFYIGIQGHPEYKSRPSKPHPLFLAFIDACIRNK